MLRTRIMYANMHTAVVRVFILRKPPYIRLCYIGEENVFTELRV